MARKRKRSQYRMTPKRRAALKKAQMASARKRRREARGPAGPTFGQTAKAIATTVAIGAIVYHGEQLARHPSRVVDGVKKAHRFMNGKGTVKRTKGTDPNAPRPQPNRLRTPGIRYYGRPKPYMRGAVAGQRITPRQRRAQGRMF